MKVLVIIGLLSGLSICTDFELATSQKIFDYSMISYCSEDSLYRWNCSLCKTLQKLEGLDYNINNLTHILAVTGYLKEINRILVIFRGT